MDAFINALKTNDLVKAKKAFGSIMSERTTALIESQKRILAAQVMIEGEKSSEEEDMDAEDDRKKSKESEIEASKKNNQKEIDDRKPDENKRTA